MMKKLIDFFKIKTKTKTLKVDLGQMALVCYKEGTKEKSEIFYWGDYKIPLNALVQMFSLQVYWRSLLVIQRTKDDKRVDLTLYLSTSIIDIINTNTKPEISDANFLKAWYEIYQHQDIWLDTYVKEFLDPYIAKVFKEKNYDEIFDVLREHFEKIKGLKIVFV